MRGFLIGLLIGVLLVPVGLFLYLRLGLMPAAALGPAIPMEKTIAGMALNAHIAREAPAKPGLPLSDEALMAGAHTYREYCAVCHGMPGQEKTPTATGMFPPPPQLFHGKGVTDDEPGETYWKVANGIRLTGMPGYRGSLSEDQLWQVTLLLAHGNQLPAAVSQFLTTPPPAR